MYSTYSTGPSQQILAETKRIHPVLGSKYINRAVRFAACISVLYFSDMTLSQIMIL